MDKYEFKLSLNEINALIDERRFDEAAGIADNIDWNRVKSANTLCRISEVYKIAGDYDKSREIMAIAYQRQPNNPAIVYALCELTIYLYNRDGMQSDLTTSLQLLNEYQKIEPGNPKRHVLQYKMYCASPVSNEEKIAVLKQLHDEKPSARWDYELAKLYAESENRDEAARIAGDVIRRYSGKYADKAQDLLQQLGEDSVGMPVSEGTGESSDYAAEPASGEPSERREKESSEPPEDTRQIGTGNPEEAPMAEAGTEHVEPVIMDYSSGASRQEENQTERDENEQAERAAAELTRRAREEKAAEANGASAVSEESQTSAPAPETVTAKTEDTNLPITTPEEQHGVDRLQDNVANGMKDILARPYDDKLEQETSGQYAMVTDQPKEEESQVAGQMSISEVMAEWEKIRSDIRKANDQKRAQRILEDTGSLLADFDETARHGLLEDIEKGVARQRRQVRSGAYRVSDALPEDRYGNRAPVENYVPEDYAADHSREDRYYQEADYPEQSRNQSGYEEPQNPSDGRYASEQEEYLDEGEAEPEQYPEEEEGRPDSRVTGNAPEAQNAQSDQISDRDGEREPVRHIKGEEPDPNRRLHEERLVRDRRPDEDRQSRRRGSSHEEQQDSADDVRVYRRRRDDFDDVATRRWNSEEIHRAMARQEQFAREEELENARAREEDLNRRRKAQSAREDADAYIDRQNQNEEPGSVNNGYENPEEEEEVIPKRQREEERIPDQLPDKETEEILPEDEEAEETLSEDEETEEVHPEDEETEEALPEGEESVTPPEENEPEEDRPEEPEEAQPVPETEDSPRKGQKRSRNSQEKTDGSPESTAEPEEAKSSQGGRELSKEERRLFGPFCRMKENVAQLQEALEQISLASSTGNLIILGNEATADRVAKGVLEIERHTDSNFTGKIAKVSGGSLNKLDANGFTKTFAKLENGALIINKAADIAPKTMERLYQELEGRDHGIILIMTDSNKKMSQFRRENAKYLDSFTAVINIRPLDDKALVAYAKDYAISQDYSIDEFGQLALAQRISTMQTSAHRVTLKEVRDLVDEAISYASRKNLHTLMEIISRKRYDENDRIIIHEKDFQHY